MVRVLLSALLLGCMVTSVHAGRRKSRSSSTGSSHGAPLSPLEAATDLLVGALTEIDFYTMCKRSQQGDAEKQVRAALEGIGVSASDVAKVDVIALLAQYHIADSRNKRDAETKVDRMVKEIVSYDFVQTALAST